MTKPPWYSSLNELGLLLLYGPLVLWALGFTGLFGSRGIVYSVTALCMVLLSLIGYRFEMWMRKP